MRCCSAKWTTLISHYAVDLSDRDDDFAIVWHTEHWGPRRIARIRFATERNLWVWHLNPSLPVPAWGNGQAESLDKATAEFKAAWQRFTTNENWIPRLRIG